MTEPQPEYSVSTDPVKVPAGQSRLPSRAWNLAMRVLELERECNRRGRLTLDVLFLDGEWWFSVTKPGELERLGE